MASIINCTVNNIGKKKDSHIDDISIFKYNDKSFNLTKTPALASGERPRHSQFDDVLIKKWEHAMENGHFRYTLEDVQRKPLPGKTKLIAQLNTKRFTQRRTPQVIQSICQPFVKSSFNFNKVKDDEVLFKLGRTETDDKTLDHCVVINVSPIEFGHVLVVPDAMAGLPQVLTEGSMRLALEMCFLSNCRGLRLGFNSLCAFASVNHLHFHAMFINQLLPIDTVEVSHVGQGLFELVDYPVNGFAMNATFKDIGLISRKVSCIIQRMVESDIPHNVFLSRGDSLQTSSEDLESTDSVRIFVFPKVMSTGAKDTQTLNSCCYDLAGYLLMKDEEQYTNMTEVDAIAILNKYTLREDEFEDLKVDLLQILQAEID